VTNIVTEAEAKEWLEIADYVDDQRISFIVASVSTMVANYCGRSFEVDTAQTATARYYRPLDDYSLPVDDCWQVTAVASDDADNGLWATVWAASDYYLEPAGGVSPAGLTGFPYTMVRAVESRTWPIAARPAAKITAKWGWQALPGDVRMAALMLVGEQYRAKSGGFDTFTTDGGFTQIRRNLLVRDLLQPYRRASANDARFVVG
jgi:hypothetical protein